MTPGKCNICKANCENVLGLDANKSVTSLGRVVKTSATIAVCTHCGHCQTSNTMDLKWYYDTEYKSLAVSLNEDDLYEIRNGRHVYRNEHQANLLISKLPQFNGEVLDYGCGKSLVMKHYMTLTGKRDVYLYDISRDYVDYWKTFLPSGQFSCYQTPDEWKGKFSLVTSFFSMEHVADPVKELSLISALLKPEGLFYLVVPNLYSKNVADMLVVDHVQHYSPSSVKKLFQLNGMDVISEDHESHLQASIYIGSKNPRFRWTNTNGNTISTGLDTVRGIAAFWRKVNSEIVLFEQQMIRKNIQKFYIVGAGIIGTHVYLQIQHPENIVGFIDSNKFKQEKGWLGKKVFSPSPEIQGEDCAVFIGLNLEQVDSVLPLLLPGKPASENIWSFRGEAAK